MDVSGEQQVNYKFNIFFLSIFHWKLSYQKLNTFHLKFFKYLWPFHSSITFTILLIHIIDSPPNAVFKKQIDIAQQSKRFI